VLDELFFFGSRRQQVDPENVRRQRIAGGELNALQPLRADDEDVEQA
jgi:hypothetical protein